MRLGDEVVLTLSCIGPELVSPPYTTTTLRRLSQSFPITSASTRTFSFCLDLPIYIYQEQFPFLTSNPPMRASSSLNSWSENSTVYQHINSNEICGDAPALTCRYCNVRRYCTYRVPTSKEWKLLVLTEVRAVQSR